MSCFFQAKCRRSTCYRGSILRQTAKAGSVFLRFSASTQPGMTLYRC
jgi:hypothetical protein